MNKNEYINISKAFSSSLVEKADASIALNSFVTINKVAEAKGLKSNRSLRLEINKPESKYIAREVKVNGGTSYEILYAFISLSLSITTSPNDFAATLKSFVHCSQ